MMKKIVFILIAVYLSVFNLGAGTGYTLEPVMSDYSARPNFLVSDVPPLVMLVMGRNHKLYYEAYNDASDLDGDGVLDVG